MRRGCLGVVPCFTQALTSRLEAGAPGLLLWCPCEDAMVLRMECHPQGGGELGIKIEKPSGAGDVRQSCVSLAVLLCQHQLF